MWQDIGHQWDRLLVTSAASNIGVDLKPHFPHCRGHGTYMGLPGCLHSIYALGVWAFVAFGDPKWQYSSSYISPFMTAVYQRGRRVVSKVLPQGMEHFVDFGDTNSVPTYPCGGAGGGGGGPLHWLLHNEQTAVSYPYFWHFKVKLNSWPGECHSTSQLFNSGNIWTAAAGWCSRYNGKQGWYCN